MIQVKNEIRVYEVDDKDVGFKEGPEFTVENHWNQTAYVVVSIDGKKYTVVAADLMAAIKNATNVNRY